MDSALTYIANFSTPQKIIYQPNQLSHLGLADIKGPLEFHDNASPTRFWRRSDQNQSSSCSFLWNLFLGSPGASQGGSSGSERISAALPSICPEVRQPPSDLPGASEDLRTDIARFNSWRALLALKRTVTLERAEHAAAPAAFRKEKEPENMWEGGRCWCCSQQPLACFGTILRLS